MIARAKLFLVIELVAFIIVALLFTFIEAIYPVMASNPSGSYVMSPGETRVLSVNTKFLCSSISMETLGSSRLSASLFVTDVDSNLTDYSSKRIEEVVECDTQCYVSWRSYLHQGSAIRFKASLEEVNVAYFINFTFEDDFTTFAAKKILSGYVGKSIPIIHGGSDVFKEISKDKAND